MLFSNFYSSSCRHCVNVLQGVGKKKLATLLCECNWQAHCPNMPGQSIILWVPVSLGISLSSFCWLASINVPCKENCHCYGPGWIDEFVVQCLVCSRYPTQVHYPGSAGCDPKGHGVDCRPLSRTLCVFSCGCPKQLCPGIPLPSMRHLFLFAGTFHPPCLLLLKGYLKCRAFISCGERMSFPPNALCQVPCPFSH